MILFGFFYINVMAQFSKAVAYWLILHTRTRCWPRGRAAEETARGESINDDKTRVTCTLCTRRSYQFEKHVSQFGPSVVAVSSVHSRFAEHVRRYAPVYVEILRKSRRVVLRVQV